MNPINPGAEHSRLDYADTVAPGDSPASITNNPAANAIHWMPTVARIPSLKLLVRPEGLTGADDSAIAAWADDSGNGNSLAQATALNKPVLKTGIIEGMSIARFDGTNSFMATDAANTVPDGQPLTILAVASLLDTSGSVRLCGHNQASAGYGAGFDGNDGRFTTLGIADHTVADSVPAGSFQLFGFSFDSGFDFSFYRNGTLIGTDTTGSQDAAATASAFRLGAAKDADTKFIGDVAEFIVCSAILSATERQMIEGYLAWKYGLEANLPSDHPYRNTPL